MNVTFHPAVHGLGAFIAIEPSSQDHGPIVEIAIGLFAYNKKTGVITRLLESYSSLQDPGMAIPAEGTAQHGITNMLADGQQLDLATANRILDRADLIVVSSLQDDRHRLEAYAGLNLKGKIWAGFPVPMDTRAAIGGRAAAKMHAAIKRLGATVAEETAMAGLLKCVSA